MNSKRAYFMMLGGLTLLGLAVLASVVLGNYYLQKQNKELISLKLDNHVLDEQQIALIQANKDISKYSALEKTANTIVPQEKDQAQVVRQIINLAGEAKIPIQYISFPSSSLGQATPKPTTVTPGQATTPKIITPPSQLSKVDGLSGVYQLEVTVQSDANNPISYDQLVNFLTKLENNRRTAQVSTISVTPNSKNRKLITFSLVVDVYIKP